jgi:hypothetical protein
MKTIRKNIIIVMSAIFAVLALSAVASALDPEPVCAPAPVEVTN